MIYFTSRTFVSLVVGAFLCLRVVLLIHPTSRVYADTVDVRFDQRLPLDAPKTVNEEGYQYDSNGNLLSDGTRVVSWNQDDKPVRVEKEGRVVNFYYDAQNRRVKKSVGTAATVYVNKYLVKGSDGGEKYYYASDSIAVNGGKGVRYLHKDHLGSVVLLTDSGSLPTGATRFYFPYGSLVVPLALASRYQYAGQEVDSGTGLYNYNARLYNPKTGTFVSADPLVGKFMSSVDFNRYLYVRGNPLRYVDRAGLDAEPIQKWKVPGLPGYKEPGVTDEQAEHVQHVVSNALDMLSPQVGETIGPAPIVLSSQGKVPYYTAAGKATTDKFNLVAGDVRSYFNGAAPVSGITIGTDFYGIGRQAHWVLHELGHLYWNNARRPSLADGFKEVLNEQYPCGCNFADLLKMKAEETGRLYNYVLVHNYTGDTYLDEMFAEVFAFYFEGDDILTAAPNLVALLNDWFGLEKEFKPLGQPGTQVEVLGETEGVGTILPIQRGRRAPNIPL